MKQSEDKMLLDDNLPSSEMRSGAQIPNKISVVTDRNLMSPGDSPKTGARASDRFSTPKLVESQFSPNLAMNN